MIPIAINDRWTLLMPEHRASLDWPRWEKERLAAMHELIEPADLVFDIGAEEGDLPALWASWGADVVLIEPDPRVWPNMRAIFEANGLEFHVRGRFVGFAGDFPRDRPAWTEEYEMNPRGAGSQGIWPSCAFGPVIGDHGFLVIPERPDCPVTTIDRLAEQYGSPTVITIDVEGAEYLVLQGARRTLIENRPAVFVSVHLDMPWLDQKFGGDTGPRITTLLSDLGYEGTHLATDHEAHWCWRHPEGR